MPKLTTKPTRVQAAGNKPKIIEEFFGRVNSDDAQVSGELFNSDGHEPIQIPIDGVLDLHTFQPKEIKDLVPAYLVACQERGILRVRIIHGKGIGNLRRTVHAVLAKLPEVVSFALANEHFGSWGATIVHLRDPQRTLPPR